MADEFFEQLLDLSEGVTALPHERELPSSLRLFGENAFWMSDDDIGIARLLVSNNHWIRILNTASKPENARIFAEEPTLEHDDVGGLERLTDGVIIPVNFVPRGLIGLNMNSHIALPDVAYARKNEEKNLEVQPLKFVTADTVGNDRSSLLEYQTGGFKLGMLAGRNLLFSRALDKARETLGCDGMLFRDGFVITDKPEVHNEAFKEYLEDSGCIRRARMLDFSEEGVRIVSRRRKEAVNMYRVTVPGAELFLFPMTRNQFKQERLQFFNQTRERRVIPPAALQIMHGFNRNGQPILSLDYAPETGIIFYDDHRRKQDMDVLDAIERAEVPVEILRECSAALRAKISEANSRLANHRRQLGELRDEERAWQLEYMERRGALGETLARSIGANLLVHTKTSKPPEPNNKFHYELQKPLRRIVQRFRKLGEAPLDRQVDALFNAWVANDDTPLPGNSWLRELSQLIEQRNPDDVRSSLGSEMTRRRLVKQYGAQLRNLAAQGKVLVEAAADVTSTVDIKRARAYHTLDESPLIESPASRPFDLPFSLEQITSLGKSSKRIVERMDQYNRIIFSVARSGGSTESYQRLPSWLKQYVTGCMQLGDNLGEEMSPRVFLADERNAKSVVDRLQADAESLQERCDTYLKQLRRLDTTDKNRQRKRESLETAYRAEKEVSEADERCWRDLAALNDQAMYGARIPMDRLLQVLPDPSVAEDIRERIQEQLKKEDKRRNRSMSRRKSKFMRYHKRLRRTAYIPMVNDAVRVFYLDIGEQPYRRVMYKAVLVPTLHV